MLNNNIKDNTNDLIIKDYKDKKQEENFETTWKEELLKKGSELYEKGKVANEELKHNIEEKMKENITVVYETKDFSKEYILEKIKDMSDEDKKELMSALKDKSKK